MLYHLSVIYNVLLLFTLRAQVFPDDTEGNISCCRLLNYRECCVDPLGQMVREGDLTDQLSYI